MENKINFDEVFKIIRFILLLIIIFLLLEIIWQHRICPSKKINFNGTVIVYVPTLIHGEIYCFPKIINVNQTSVFDFFSDEQPNNSSNESYNTNE